MYRVSYEYNQAAINANRGVRCVLNYKYGSNTYTLANSQIISFKFKESLSSGSNISLGESCSNYIELVIASGSHPNIYDYVLYPSVELLVNNVTQGKCPLGTFYITECVEKDGKYTITAYDKMALLNVEYEPAITFPATCTQVLQDIKNQFAINYSTTNLITTDSVITSIKCTVREMLGYIAGLNGCNARFDKSGLLSFTTFSKAYFLDSDSVPTTTQYTIDDNFLYQSNVSYTNTYTIQALVSGEGENEIKSGNGKAITFANPFMTQTILNNLVSARLPISYAQGEFKYRGNPCYEIGDIIRVNSTVNNLDLQIPIMSQEISFDGGMSCSIQSYGMSDNLDVISNFKSNTYTLERNITKLEDMQNMIIGATDGCYELLYNEETNSAYGTAWWKDSSKTIGWKFTYGGLGYFYNNVLQHIGITSDGSIIADNIESGSIITNSFKIGKSDSDYAMSFDGSTGKIAFGSGVSITWEDITDTPTIPTSTSELENDSGYITDGDIPSKTSDLTNDSGFINSSTATTITNNAISTATIRANQVTAGSFTMTGGTIDIDTTTSDYSAIKLNYGSYSMSLSPIRLEFTGTSSNSAKIRLYNGSSTTLITPSTISVGGYYVATTADLAKYATESYVSSYCSGFYTSGDNIYANRLYVQNAGTLSGSANARLGVSSPYQLGYASSSSRKFKHDIKPVENTELDPKKLYDIEVVQFKFNDDYLSETDQRYQQDCIGMIAEQVNEVYPIAADCETGEPLNWEDRYLIPPMIALIQEQHKDIEKLKERIEELENGQITISD